MEDPKINKILQYLDQIMYNQSLILKLLTKTILDGEDFQYWASDLELKEDSKIQN